MDPKDTKILTHTKHKIHTVEVLGSTARRFSSGASLGFSSAIRLSHNRNSRSFDSEENQAMVRYSQEPDENLTTSKARGSSLRVHFKNTRETAKTIKGMKVEKAKRFLRDVIDKKQCVPFRRFNGGVGRKAQAKAHGWTQGRWPKKSAKILLDLLINAESNAEFKTGNVIISHIQVNAAQTQRRRTYRAHGRINPYVSHPCHVEMILTEQPTTIPKAAESRVQ
eukprot:gnl/Trimastix_PCT/112.p1 GENE.gnl/Trimastix_PCT/112~~gnl/Trimastix_PCT/112.p1  ORF type:complete len:223 (+),score=41.83 gnl/Trimastix_PCT/112:400-1068(+)